MKNLFRIRIGIFSVFSFCVIPVAIAAPTHLVDEAPIKMIHPKPNVILLDFGRVAFGNLRISAPNDASGTICVHFGEALKGGRVDRKPPGSVRYSCVTADLKNIRQSAVAPPADKQNTHQPSAVLTPKEWGVVTPFRWVEIEGWPGKFNKKDIIRQSAYLTAWDDNAASFKSSDNTLNRIWELCRYSIKATSFAGVYVDGDRERISYEADAYIHQISQYVTDRDTQMARDSFDRLMKLPTWPSEWAPHMIFMAHADWMHTGDKGWLAAHYESLKSKMFNDRLQTDGWIHSDQKQQDIQKQQDGTDIVDWPPVERDHYIFSGVNTVVNAFRLAALSNMADLAKALGKNNEEKQYTQLFNKSREQFNKELYIKEKGAYRDGIGTDHTSLHASLFPLAFGLVPEDQTKAVTRFLTSRGMVCSVYAAQYLLEGLFANDAADAALHLILADNDCSWKYMVNSGTTITWESWDAWHMKYTPNQDWSHAWGSAPANLLPRFVLGAEPLAPGWKSVRIRPNTGSLTRAKGKISSVLGPLYVEWTKSKSFRLKLTLPEGMTAHVELPAPAVGGKVLLDGKSTAIMRKDDRLIVKRPITGKHVFSVDP
jgi:alpha-L-rhamnosidase